MPLPMPVTVNTTIGAWSFPQFGSQQAQITVIFPDGVIGVAFEFEPQDLTPCTKYYFTHLRNTFDYRWTVTSIFASGFRHRTEGSPWSDWITGNQIIDLRGER